VGKMATFYKQAIRRKPQHLEAIEQRLFVKRWRTDPRTRAHPACAVPNGGRRSAREASLMKAEGVEAGVPDWLCFWPSFDKRAVGLAIEFKSPTGKGRVSDNQKRWHELLRNAGWRVEIVTTAADAWRVVTSHLGISDG
jgi:hypothetical protein